MSSPLPTQGPVYWKEIERLERERNELLRKSGLTPATNSLQDGRLVGKVPGTNTKYVYDNGEWKRTFGGGYKKIAKNKIRQKCAKSSKKSRYSHYKNTAKRSRRRRTNQK